MRKSRIIHIVNSYFLKLKEHFSVVQKSTTSETIKPLRIEIKKLRAFLRLVMLESKEPHRLELPQDLEKLHKTGGKVRDLQLHEQRIREAVKKTPGVLFNLNNLLYPSRKELKKEKKHFFSHKDFPGKEKKLIENLPAGYNTATIKRFFRQKLDGIAEIIAAGTYTDKELHSIRKKLKDVLYIIKLYRIEIKRPLGFRFWNSKELQKAKNLEDLLGFFNDSCNALSLLNSFDFNKAGNEEKKLVNNVRRQVLAKKRELKSQVLISVKELNLVKP